MNDTIAILKRLRRRMQMKSVRLLQVLSKKKKHNHKYSSRGSGGGAWLIMRAHTWENACLLIDEEIGALECQIEKLNK